MKKLTLAALLVSSALYMSSCGKYEEGPSISLRSKKARVANTWKVEAVLENGVDKTSSYSSFYDNFSLEFTKDGVYSTSTVSNGTTVTETGTWEFINDDEAIKTTVDGDSDTLSISKLKNSEFWIYNMDGTDKMEWHLAPKE